MAGYTPVFDSIFTGTLCGKYPDTAAWLFLLALADKNGATVTGMPAEILMDCIGRFIQPDPHSRSSAEEGRRLILLNTERNWGWKIVNHAAYREKARLMAKNTEAVSSGKEAERKRHVRTSAGVRRCPPVSDPSDADADADKNDHASSLRSDSIRQSSSLNSETDDLKNRRGGEKRRPIQALAQSLAHQKRLP
jgi:hypothetical protein